MADKAPKGKSVLGTLPATRPERLGAPRGRAAKRAPAKPAAAARRTATNAAAPKPRAVRRAPGKPKLAAGARPIATPRAVASGPLAVRPASPPLHTQRSNPPPEPLGAPKGTELVTTAIRATGELAQIGFVLGGKALKRAVDRIPRP